MTNSKCLFDFITKCSTAKEKRLLVDLSLAKGAYDNMKIEAMGHGPSVNNPANALSAVRSSKLFKKILEKGTLTIPLEQWVKSMNNLEPF